jgi:hypothetical protein
MATSEKRVTANRQNAKKSTGPRTLDGKERARLNAVTHGLTAQTAVLPGEDPGELEALGKSLMRQLKPRGVVQRIIAERVVSLAWKLRRVARAEEAVAREMHDNAVATWKHERNVNLANERFIFPERDRPKARDGATLLAASWEHNKRECRDERLLRLTEYELKLDGALRAAVRELLKLQKEADAFEDGEEEPAEITGGENEANAEPEAAGRGRRRRGSRGRKLRFQIQNLRLQIRHLASQDLRSQIRDLRFRIQGRVLPIRNVPQSKRTQRPPPPPRQKRLA